MRRRVSMAMSTTSRCPTLRPMSVTRFISDRPGAPRTGNDIRAKWKIGRNTVDAVTP
jgi:hypothetical protein